MIVPSSSLNFRDDRGTIRSRLLPPFKIDHFDVVALRPCFGSPRLRWLRVARVCFGSPRLRWLRVARVESFGSDFLTPNELNQLANRTNAPNVTQRHAKCCIVKVAFAHVPSGLPAYGFYRKRVHASQMRTNPKICSSTGVAMVSKFRRN